MTRQEKMEAALRVGCPACGASLTEWADETPEDYAAWDYACGASVIRVEGKYVANDECSQALTEGIKKAALSEDRAVSEPVQPVAWAILATNGNCRLWWADRLAAEIYSSTHDIPLTPLYRAPPDSAQSGGAVRLNALVQALENPTEEMLKAFQTAFIAQLQRRGKLRHKPDQPEIDSAEKAGARAFLKAALTAPGASVGEDSEIEQVLAARQLPVPLTAEWLETHLRYHYFLIDCYAKLKEKTLASDPTPQDAKADAVSCHCYDDRSREYCMDKNRCTPIATAYSSRTLPPSASKPVTVEEIAPTEAQTNSACMSFRHDFGLLSQQQRREVRFTALEWLRAWRKEGFLINAQMDWQPIDSAPKDGREIEVKYLTDDPRRVRWSTSSHGTTWHLTGAFAAEVLRFDPTHWRPSNARTSGVE